MTGSQAEHLIEQFAAQAPFAVWILDSRGVAIFANEKLCKIIGFSDRPSDALGVNVLEDPSIEQLGLGEQLKKLQQGEIVNTVIDIPGDKTIKTNVDVGAKEPLTLQIIGYALFSSTRKVENYVVFLEDVTDTYDQREQLHGHAREIKTFLTSKESRVKRVNELKKLVTDLERQIHDLGAEPEEEK